MSDESVSKTEGSSSESEEDIPGVLGCLGFLFQITVFTVVWLGFCFLLFWKVGKEAAAVGFFVPPIAGAIWTMLSKVGDGKTENTKDSSQENSNAENADNMKKE